MNSNKTIGKLTLPNGGKYEGEIIDGNPTGKGVVKFDNGETFEGTFINGVPNGWCRRSWDNGMYLESEYKAGEPVEGTEKCKIIYDDGSYYEGDCINGKPDGWGKSVQPGLSEREGEWRNGEPHGYSINKVSNARAAQVGASAGWTGEGVITQSVQRQWWIKNTNGKSEVILARDNFDIPQEDLPLSLKARLFLGFIDMYIENDKSDLGVAFSSILYPESNKFGYLLAQPIEKKAEAYYDWLLEEVQTAESVEEYTALAKKFSNISEYRNCAALAEKCKQLVTKKKGEKMPENKLMGKLVAGFNDMYQSMQSQINKLNFEIKRLESEDNEVVRQENEVTEAINNYPPFVPYPGDLDSQIQREYQRWSEKQSKLLDKRKKLRDRHYDLVKEHDKLVAERDSLSKKLGSLSSLSAEAKGETYYRWLVKNYDAAKSEDFAKSETEYTELAKKFSDISGYKDCAALAVKCKELAEEAKRTVQMQAAIAELDKELNAKLKPLDDAIAALKKKLPDFKKTLTVNSIVGAVIGCILFFAATDYPDKGEFAGVLGLWLGSGVVALFCLGWKPGGCLAWLSAIVFVILTLVLVFGGRFNEFWLMTGIWLLYLLGGAIVSVLLCYLYKNNKKRIIQQEIANLENQKFALRSEYERIKDTLVSEHNCEKRLLLFREFQEKADKIVVNGVTCTEKTISDKNKKKPLIGGVVVGAIVLLSVVCYFSLRPYDPVKDAKKTVAADCDYAAKYNDARMKIYEEFVNSFDSYGFTKRQEARNKLQELLNPVNTEYSIHQSAVRSGSGFFSYCGDGASEDLIKFANAYDTQADMYYPSNQRELSSLYTEVENKITSINDPDNNEQGVVINGVTWATRNVNNPGTFAAKPENVGKFYQWNRRKARAATDKESEWVGSNQTGDTWAAANDPSPAGWRVPTLDELKSLVNRIYVASEWTTQNGVEGRKFTDKGTGASIFLPAINGSHGSYWSSESTSCPCDDSDCAFGLSFDSNYVESFRYAAEQYCGTDQSIRPVAKK